MQQISGHKHSNNSKLGLNWFTHLYHDVFSMIYTAYVVKERGEDGLNIGGREKKLDHSDS